MSGLAGLNAGLRPYADAALQWASYYGLKPVITSVFRGWTEQVDLRNRYERCLASGPVHPGREAGCRYPANQPGDSAHNYGLAWDSWVPAEQMPTWTAIRRWVGFRVPDHDQVHAELPDWRSYVTARPRNS